MTFATVAAVTGVLAAGASIYGARKNAQAIEEGSEASIAFQNRALDTQVALSRPQLEVANGALGQLAGIFGLPAPNPIDFDNLGSGTGRSFGGAEGFQEATAGLVPIPGATWKTRAVFTDGKGGLYTTRGRDATLGRDGVEFLGQAGEGNRGTRFNGASVKTAKGILSYRDGQFFEHRGPKAEVLGIPEIPTPTETVTQQPGTTESGTGGLNLTELVTNNPLVQFQQQQGEQAIARGAAARGLNQSGGTLKDLSTFNQGVASSGIQNFVLNPLFQLAGFGPQASAQIGGAVSSNANNLSNLTMGAANARGSAFQSAGNEIGNQLGGLSNLAALKAFGVV